MDYEKIKALLERYFEADTTLDEEAQLQDFFTVADDLPPELDTYRVLFVWQQTEQAVRMSDTAARRMSEPWALRPVHQRRIAWTAAAAILIGLLAFSWWYRPSTALQTAQPIDWSLYEVQSEKEAVLLTFKVLNTTATGLQTASQQVIQQAELLDPAAPYLPTD